MAELTKAEVFDMAQRAGLSLDDQRAEVIASRLGAVLEALAEIPDGSLEGLESALTFSPKGESDD